MSGGHMHTRLETLKQGLLAWLRSEEGQGLTEYALILALVAIAAIVALTLLGNDVTSALSSAATSI